MTLDQFFEELAKLKDKSWYRASDYSGSIRYDDPSLSQGFPRCFCPITAVCLEKTKIYYRTGMFLDAADELDLDQGEVLPIVEASDGTSNNPKVKKLRDRLIKVLRIGE